MDLRWIVLFIKLKITLAINEFTPDDAMKTGHFSCVFIQELTGIMSPNTFISQPLFSKHP